MKGEIERLWERNAKLERVLKMSEQALKDLLPLNPVSKNFITVRELIEVLNAARS